MEREFKWIFVLGLLAISTAAEAMWKADLTHGSGKVEFTAIGRPSMLRVVGRGARPEGSLQIQHGKLQGTLGFDLESLDTGIGMRNQHMKEKYLETGKYPRASLRLEPTAVPASGTVSLRDLPFRGRLQLHGVEREIAGVADLRGAGREAEGTARFKIKLSDFGITVPKFAGVTIADEVEIVAETKAPAEGTP